MHDCEKGRHKYRVKLRCDRCDRDIEKEIILSCSYPSNWLRHLGCDICRKSFPMMFMCRVGSTSQFDYRNGPTFADTMIILSTVNLGDP